MPIDSIDEVLAALNTIIDDAGANASRVGYLPRSIDALRRA
jgi:hypothetical protein